MILSLDFETRSTVDLRRTGVYPYAQHPHTGVWCCAWAIDDGDVDVWTPNQPVPEAWLDALAEGAEFRAWNAQFERVMWEHHCRQAYRFPAVPLEQWQDTAAEAAAMSLPRSLGHCAEVLGVAQQKDKHGHALMLRMARPRSMKGTTPVWWNDPERIAALIDYCKQDVRTERDVFRRVRRLVKREQRVYELDQRINDRGVLIDVPLVEAAREVAEMALDNANDLIASLTDGNVSAVTKAADLTRWLQDKGLPVEDVRKSTVRELLEGEGLGGDARRVLEIRAEGARTSVAKLDAMMRAKCDDDRVRGMLLYHGASTGRWSGKLVQLHNFPRPEMEITPELIELMLDRDYAAIDAIHPPLVLISSMLRSMLVPSEGNEFFAADFNAIEARVVAWLAGEQELLALFAADSKVYESFASKVYHRPVEEIAKDSSERQLGKATVLGCGFGMGGEKFQRSAFEQYGLKITRQLADDVVALYRSTYPSIPHLWREVEGAAMMAVRQPGTLVFAGHSSNIKLLCEGSYLWIGLPSGRPLAYPLPRITVRTTPWGEDRPALVSMGMNSYTRKWQENALYGGLLVENIVQAVARDLLAASMLRVERENFPVVMTVHDEIVCDVPAGSDFDHYMRTVSRAPKWADGCPVKAEGWRGSRYRK